MMHKGRRWVYTYLQRVKVTLSDPFPLVLVCNIFHSLAVDSPLPGVMYIISLLILFHWGIIYYLWLQYGIMCLS